MSAMTIAMIAAWAAAAAAFAAYAAMVASEVTYVTLADGRRQERSLPLVFKLLLPFAGNFNGMLARPAFAKQVDAADALLVSAGFEGLLNGREFVALKFLVPIAIGALWSAFILAIAPLMEGTIIADLKFLFCAMGFVLMYAQPMMWLRGALKKRHLEIMKALPFVLDILTLSVEAGMDFISALQRNCSARKMDALNEELLRMTKEIQVGRSRREALRSMAERVNQADLRSVAFALVQADELGVSIGSILRIQSEQLRSRRFDRAEKLASEAPTKMLFPLMFCIFPAVFIILLIPVLSQTLKGILWNLHSEINLDHPTHPTMQISQSRKSTNSAMQISQFHNSTISMKRPQIIILTGEMAGKRYDIPDGGMRLGRSSSNDVHIPDEELSRNHCLFEPDGTDAIRIIDLASANGTYVNSVQLGADAKVLKIGDIIEAGRTAMKVVEKGSTETITAAPEPPPGIAEPINPPPPRTAEPVNPPSASAGPVDLGLDGGTRGADIVADATPEWNKKRSLRANILWGVVAILVASAIALMLLMPSPMDETVATHGPVKASESAGTLPSVTELRYEKIDADSSHIFRFFMTVDANGVMSVVCDDVPGEMRHIEKKKELSKEEKEHIAKIFADEAWRSLDRAYSGSSSIDENRLESYRICAMGNNGIRETTVENTTEPAAFRNVREALEAFSRNELGIWALQYSREELMKLVKDSEDLGDSKWSERDVQYGNLATAVKAYQEAVFYMDTLEPKPDGYRQLREKHDRAVAELDKRYKDQRFVADRAINLSDWETARKELRTLLDMVTDTEDPRHSEAKAKLVDVEKRLNRKKGKK